MTTIEPPVQNDPAETRIHSVCSRCLLERSQIPVLQFALTDDDALGLLPAETRIPQQTPPLRTEQDHEAIRRLEGHSRRDPETGCLVWQGGMHSNSRYGLIHYRGKNYRAHRLSYIAHHGPIQNGFYVCHTCDNPSCVAIEHLFLGTPYDNVMDMRKKGRGNAKYTEAQVAAAKRLLADGATRAEAAERTGIHFMALREISAGRTWAHVAAAPKVVEE